MIDQTISKTEALPNTYSQRENGRRPRVELPDRPADQPSMNVVVRHHGESFSLLVDEVGDVINVGSESLHPAPQTLDAHWKSVTVGVFRLERRLFVILNVAALLSLK